MTSTEEITGIDVGATACEKISQSTEMSENITDQKKITETATEDLAEQVVPCAEAKQEEAEDNVPQTDLLTERESEGSEAEAPAEETQGEGVSTEKKQVEKEAEEVEEEEDDGSGDHDNDEEETEKEPQTRKDNKKEVPREPKNAKPTPMNLNNEVVNMRKEVSRVRALLIRKLTRQIAALKKKKGNENEVQKNQRRAARMVEEIHEMKALKQDVVTKIALQQEIVFDLVCRNPASSVTDRAIARIASHPQFSKRIAAIKLAVKAFKEERAKNSGPKRQGDNAAQRGKPQLAYADEKTQRNKMEEEEESEEPGDSEEEEEEEEEEKDSKDSEDGGVKQTTAEGTPSQNRNLSGVSMRSKIGDVPEPLKKAMPRNRKPSGLVNNTPRIKVTEKRPNNKSTATEKTCVIEDDTQESCLDKSEEDLHINSPPPSEGAKAMEDANNTVVKSDPHTKVTVMKREVTAQLSTTAVNKGASEEDESVDEEEESFDDATEEIPHKGTKSDLKVHQGVEDDDDVDDEEGDSDLESDEEDESDSSAEEPARSPDSEIDSLPEAGVFTKYSEAKDLKKPLRKAGDKQPSLKPALESNQKTFDDDESDLDSSDEEEVAKEYFDDSTEERFRKRSSQSESESDDDFFLGKVSKFKKKKKKTDGSSAKSEATRGTPSEPEGASEVEPGPSDSQGSAFTSLFCQSLSRSEGGGGGSGGDGGAGGQRFGGRGRGRGGRSGGGMRAGGRGGFDSRPPRFNSRAGGETAESDFGNAKRDFKSRPFGTANRGRDFTGRGRERGSGRGRGGISRQPDRSGAGFGSHQPAQQSLHPSWEASKKRKEQQGQIQAFQGKKIKFDDDD